MRRAVLLVSPFLLLGCGGPSREDALSSAKTWLRAVGEGDSGRACELMHASAVKAVARRFPELGRKPVCHQVIDAYRDAFDDGELGKIAGSLETEGAVKNDEIGIFPASGARELQVILMQHREGAWKVGSTTLSP